MKKWIDLGEPKAQQSNRGYRSRYKWIQVRLCVCVRSRESVEESLQVVETSGTIVMDFANEALWVV